MTPFDTLLALQGPSARRYPIVQGGHGKTRYGPWTIYFDPPPIPCRNFDWHFAHDDLDASYEGEEDGYVSNGLCGSCASFGDALNECDEIEDEYRERIEARRAETPKSGSVHESRVRQHLAQNTGHPSKDEESI